MLNVNSLDIYADAEQFTDGAIHAGSATFESLTANFQPDCVGKKIIIYGAGESHFGEANDAHETTVVSWVSGSRILLTNEASNTVANATFVYGTDYSDLVATAITQAAASTDSKTLYFPGGNGKAYMFNADFSDVNILGEGSGVAGQFDVEPGPWSQSFYHNRYKTIFVPATTSLAVIRVGWAQGSFYQDFCIFGSKTYKGKAFQVSNLLTSGVGNWSYCGNSCRMTSVLIAGFYSGYYNRGATDFVLTNVNSADCVRPFHLVGAEAKDENGGTAPTDSIVFVSCIGGATPTSDSESPCKYIFYIDGHCTDIQVVGGGGYNGAEHLAYIGTAAELSIDCNSEGLVGIPFECDDYSRLNIRGGRYVGTSLLGKPLVRAIGSIGAVVKISTTVTTDCVLGEAPLNILTYWFDTSAANNTLDIPNRGVIRYFPDNTFDASETSYITEFCNDTFGKTLPPIGVQHHFGHLSATGWLLTNISGSGVATGSNNSPQGGNIGELLFATGSSVNGDKGSLTLPNCFLDMTVPWVLTLKLEAPDLSHSIFKFGLFADITSISPDGVYIHVDRTTPDATWKVTVRSGGVPTTLDTLAPYDTYGGSVITLRLRNTVTWGLIVDIQNPIISKNVELWVPTPGIPAAYGRPGILLGNSNASQPTIGLNTFELRPPRLS